MTSKLPEPENPEKGTFFVDPVKEALIAERDQLKRELKITKDSLERSNKIRASWKAKAERMESALKSVVSLDKTPEYEYGQSDRQGNKPGLGRRWKTPKEIAKLALTETEGK